MADSSEPIVAPNTAPTTTASAQDGNSQEKLKDLIAQATALYAVKKYEEASELYSEATEIQAEINGEMSEDNADLLFAYGRCLFHVAQKTSTVLGGTATSAQLKGSNKKPSKKRKANGSLKTEAGPSTLRAEESTTAQPIVETTQPADIVPAEDVNPGTVQNSLPDKPFFRIEGDAPDWGDSDDEDDEGGEGEDAEGEDAEEEEEEDDFNTSFEILDLSRVLYLRRLTSLQTKSSVPDDPTTQTQTQVTHLQTRLSDIYDLQSEISLEGEKFPAAVADLRSCLELKLQLYPQESSHIAECHYKLSLALEAASQIQQHDADGNPVGDIQIDWPMRNEAASEQAKAIESCKLRVAQETKEMDTLPADKDKERLKAKENIDDVEDMIQAMEQRLEELKVAPVSVKAEAEKEAAQELMGTVLGQMLGAGGSGATSKDEQKAKLAEIVSGANDLTGMVKRKKPKVEAAAVPVSAAGAEPAAAAVSGPEVNGKGKGKRSIDEVDEEETANHNNNNGIPPPPATKEVPVKKVRIEDVID